MKAYVENARVERIFDVANGSTGVSVVEKRTVGDREFTMWATLWFRSRPENVQVGDVVNASGYLSVRSKVLDNGRAAADINLNGAQIQSVQPGAAPAAEHAGDDPWATSSSGWGE
jgi:hypothetical protein